MTVEELDRNERRAFLVCHRNLARLEENDRLVLTPFEKDIDMGRQLWRMLECSDLLVMVADARDSLFYRCPDLEVLPIDRMTKHREAIQVVADRVPRKTLNLSTWPMNEEGSKTAAKEEKEAPHKHKHHKKPQRKKDGSWRVGNDGGDGRNSSCNL